jgi:hypothetical protein
LRQRAAAPMMSALWMDRSLHFPDCGLERYLPHGVLCVECEQRRRGRLVALAGLVAAAVATALSALALVQ